MQPGVGGLAGLQVDGGEVGAGLRQVLETGVREVDAGFPQVDAGKVGVVSHQFDHPAVRDFVVPVQVNVGEVGAVLVQVM